MVVCSDDRFGFESVFDQPFATGAFGCDYMVCGSFLGSGSHCCRGAVLGEDLFASPWGQP
jgi:hypothetical protein